MNPVEVHVALGHREIHAGSLYCHRRRGTESSTFAYLPEYLSAEGACPLDPELPLGTGARQTRAGQPLFGALTDCSPDRWGRMLIHRREAVLAREEKRTPRTLGEIDYLLGVRDDLRQGDLRFRLEQGPFLAEENTGVPALTDLPALLDLAARAESGRADLPDLQRLVRAGSSLGGARPKAHVRDQDGRIAIAKFPSADHDTWNVMAWEKVALDLAGRAGIDVPRSRLLNLAGRHVLLLNRFDRTDDGRRIGYVSAMTLLEAADGDRRSYVDIAEAIEDVSADVTRHLHQLWRRLVFSVLITNTDDHLRNHGFLRGRNGTWRLSPAFDLNPNPAPGPQLHATMLDETDEPATLHRALAVAEFFRLTDPEARTILAETTEAVGRWRDVAARHGLPPSEITAMAPAFTALTETDRL
ncbi:MAG: serine/threonine-protein kinase HipA [Actinomycetota bacterium]|nr:serine/threonine-protein kinase HipA [Actinomycetota bacterium]